MAIAIVISLYAAFLIIGWFAARKVKDGTAQDLIVRGVILICSKQQMLRSKWLLAVKSWNAKNAEQFGLRPANLFLIMSGATCALLWAFCFSLEELHF